MDKSKQGKKNRQTGQAFELATRKYIEANWNGIIFKNPNNVIDNKFTQARAKFNPYTKRPMMIGAGFPDFIFIGKIKDIIGIEAKSNGYLTPEEREKADWLLRNEILDKFIVSYKNKNTKQIEFKEFK